MGEAKRRKALDPTYGKVNRSTSQLLVEEINQDNLPTELVEVATNLKAELGETHNVIPISISQGSYQLRAIGIAHLRRTRPGDGHNETHHLTTRVCASKLATEEAPASWIKRIINGDGSKRPTPAVVAFEAWMKKQTRKASLLEITH